jgi:5-methylcytosine-specific restriction endonuclease McrA
MGRLQKNTVLVLNKNWQAINVKTPQDAFCMIATGAATGLDIDSSGNMTPITWQKWIELEVREGDNYIKTVKGHIRIPTVIILCKFNQVPKRRPKFSSKAIWERDKGICQYTGKKLKPGEGNIDHVIPKQKGGQTSWTNCVLSCTKVNAKKGNKTPEEMGLKLLREPFTPKELPSTLYIKNHYSIPEWDYFLCHN